MSLLDAVEQRLDPAEITRISQKVGIDEGTTRRAVQTAVPSMVAGMTGHAQTPSGASSLQGVLGNLGSLGNLASGAGGGGLLGKILGQHQDAVHNEVQASTGLDAGKTKSLLSELAPIVLSALSDRGGSSAAAGAGQGGIGGMLAREAQALQPGGASASGLLGKVLGQLG